MKKVLCCLAVMLLVSTLTAATAVAGFDGSWTADVPRGNGRLVPATFNFEVDGSTLSGSISAVDKEFPITDGKIKDDEISFTVGGATGYFSGRLNGSDEIKMRVKYDGGENGTKTLAFVAKRAK